MALAGRGAPRAPGLQREQKGSTSVRAITGQTARQWRANTFLRSADAQNKSQYQNTAFKILKKSVLILNRTGKICFNFAKVYPIRSEII